MSTTVSARFVTPATSLTRIMATLNKEFNVIRNETMSELVDKNLIRNAFELARHEEFKTSFDMKFEINSFYEDGSFDIQNAYASFYIKGKYYHLHIFNDITGHDLKDALGELTPHITISLGSDAHRATPELIQRFAFAVKEELKCRVIYKDEAVSDDHTEL